MRTPEGRRARLVFEGLTFDPGSGELTGPSGVERLAPKPASLLALLTSRPGDMVTRDEIREHLWPGGKVEFEQGIAFAVREVRKAIEAAGGNPGVIETIPKRGFRLGVAPDAPALAPAQARTPPPTQSNSRAFLRPLVALVAVVAAVAFSVRFSGRATEPSPVVAIFTHTTEPPVGEALARAIAFELTTAMTSAFGGRIDVVGPTGVASLTGPEDTEGARDHLGACLVVSGGIRATRADTLVVFTQIVRTSDRVHAWAGLDTVAARTAATTVVSHVLDGVRRTAEAC